MRSVSLNARTSHDAQATSEIEVVLLHITHPDLLDAVKLSTDPTVRLSTDPLKYGTRSTWLAEEYADDTPYNFVLLNTQLPDDKEDTPAAASVTVEMLDNTYSELFRSTQKRATVHMAIVMASTPNLVEVQWRDLKLVSAEGDNAQITMQITRDPITSEPWPYGRMTRYRFPGLM